MLEALLTVFSEQLALKGVALLEFNGEADHLHLLIELPPTQTLSGVVNSLKTVSSRLVRKWYRAELAALQEACALEPQLFHQQRGQREPRNCQALHRASGAAAVATGDGLARHRPPSLAAAPLRLAGALREFR